jgi:hypothetical protein
MNTTTKVVLGVVGGVVLLLIASCGIGAYAFYAYVVKPAEASMIPHSTYESIRVGESETEVLRRLPAKASDLAKLGDDEKEHPKPAGATCRYHLSDGVKDPDGDTTWYAYRFCFAGGKLVEKKMF